MTKSNYKWKIRGGIFLGLAVLIGSLFPVRLLSFTLGEKTLLSESMATVKLPESAKAYVCALDDDRDIQQAANHLYRNGVKFYYAGKYWDCAQELIILLDFYPQFEKIDGVIYYVAESLNEMQMNKPALKMFKYLLKTYPKSQFIPHTLLGLQKTYFREKRYKEAMQFYFLVIKNNYDSKLVDVARYYHGQSNFYMKKWDNAILILRRITNSSEYYDHALYTTALAMLKKKEFAQPSNISSG